MLSGLNVSWLVSPQAILWHEWQFSQRKLLCAPPLKPNDGVPVRHRERAADRRTQFRLSEINLIH